ncbi:MAG: single-stranded DNA-binding protein [Lactobacillaceae bacterium]|jgi:single-strand DNA-binding protein|nr:single-stranded DNA-binding protein [Lactobacillaceae bacterium]
MNSVNLTGRIVRVPELRYTPTGVAVATFTLASERNRTNQNGEREADFINIVIWRKAAENFVNMTTKGSQVAITGRINTRQYDNQQGQHVFVTEVVVDNFTLLETKAETDARRQSVAIPENQIPTPDANDPFSKGNVVEIPDDQLPF